MKLSNFWLVVLLSASWLPLYLNSSDSDIDSESGEENQIYLINWEAIDQSNTPGYSYHVFRGDGSWQELWEDLISTDAGDFDDLTAPHEFIVRLKDDFEDTGLFNYDVHDNVLWYETSSHENIPFEYIRTVQRSLDDPIYGNLRAKIEDASGDIPNDYVLIEVN